MIYRAARGNALPETALTLTLVLLVFLGLVELAMVGFVQAEADGAAFVAAHAAAMASDAATQSTRGPAHASGIFSLMPSGNISVTTGTTGGPNGTGEVVGNAFRLTAGLFAGQSVTLRSHVVEPVVSAPYSPTSANLTIVQAQLPNCLTLNPATPSCSSNVGLATYDPTDTADPYHNFECHQTYYDALTNGTSGTTVGATPWPEEYQPTTHGSINWPSVRASGIYLDNAGHLGTALAPMYSWDSGTPCS
ncbi:MAG: hypothetical protein ACLPYS_19740 [Vulcanimicrobiaceae bacterium]